MRQRPMSFAEALQRPVPNAPHPPFQNPVANRKRPRHQKQRKRYAPSNMRRSSVGPSSVSVCPSTSVSAPEESTRQSVPFVRQSVRSPSVIQKPPSPTPLKLQNKFSCLEPELGLFDNDDSGHSNSKTVGHNNASKNDKAYLKGSFVRNNVHRQSQNTNNSYCRDHKSQESNDNIDTEQVIMHIPTNKTQNTYVTVHVSDIQHRALIDTGAQKSCISAGVYQNLNNSTEISSDSGFTSFKGANGAPLQVLGTCYIQLTLGGQQFNHLFYVLASLDLPIILGADFLEENGIDVSCQKHLIHWNNGVNKVKMTSRHANQSCATLFRIGQTTNIPANHEAIIPIFTNNVTSSSGFIKPTNELTKLGLVGAKCLVNLNGNKTCMRLYNPTNHDITIPKKSSIGMFDSIENPHIAFLGNALDSKYPDDTMPLIANLLNYTDTPTNSSLYNQLLNLTAAQKQEYTSLANELNIDFTSSSLNNEQKELLILLIGKNRQAFAKDMSELGQCTVYKHHIDTGDSQPIRKRFYRVSPEHKREIERQCDELVSNGIITESDTLWNSPVLLVKKKSGEFRMVVDLRALNTVAKPQYYPLPRLEDVVDSVGESKAQFYSCLDLLSGFNQIGLTEESKNKLGIITHNKVYRFERLCFGLNSAPAAYQYTMQRILQNLGSIALAYVDDVLVYSRTFEEHLEHLQIVFDRLIAANMKIKPSKCQFGKNKVTYLGHVFSNHGIQVDPQKIEAVKSFPVPTKVKHIQSFLGLCNYYRKFVKDYSKIASSLSELTKKDIDFVWTDARQNAFETLKQKLVEAPILAFPDFDNRFYVTSDSSDFACGFYLSQYDKDGKECVIAYGGRSLSSQERKYSATEKELLGLISAIKHFRCYVTGREFTARTDHCSLQYLKSLKDPTGRLGRWLMFLQEYQIKIEYIKGKSNVVADALSRREYEPHPDFEEDLNIFALDAPESQDDITTDSENENDQTPQTNATDLSQSTNLANLQLEDTNFNPIIQYLKNGDLPTAEKPAKNLTIEAQNYTLDDNNVLYHWYYPRGHTQDSSKIIKQLAVPKALRRDIMFEIHDSHFGGHLALDKCYPKLRNRYYWPNSYTDLKTYIRECANCQINKVNRKPYNKCVEPLPIVQKPFARTHFDILGPLKSVNGYIYVIVFVCAFSKWVECFPMRTASAKEVANITFNEIITRFGCIESLHSDRGTNFLSKVMKKLCEMFKIKRTLTASFAPQCNAQVERINSYIAQNIRAYITESHDNWPNLLRPACMAYNSSVNASTNLSPYFCLFGREPNNYLDTALSYTNSENIDTLSDILTNLETAKEIATENMKIAQRRYASRVDDCAVPNFKVGDLVLVTNKKPPKGTQCRKFLPKFVGPLMIIDVLPKGAFKLFNVDTSKLVKAPVNLRRIKPFYAIKPDSNATPKLDIDIVPTDNSNDSIEAEQTQGVADTVDDAVDNQIDPDGLDYADAQPTQIKGVLSKIKKCTRYQGKVIYHCAYERDDMSTFTLWKRKEDIPPDMVKDFHIQRYNNGKLRKLKKGKRS